MMYVAVVKTEEQFNEAGALAAKRGLRIAVLSNVGLEHPWQRVTFVPESAFVTFALPPTLQRMSEDDW